MVHGLSVQSCERFIAGFMQSCEQVMQKEISKYVLSERIYIFCLQMVAELLRLIMHRK